MNSPSQNASNSSAANGAPAPSADQGGWLPIETVPSGETDVLTYGGGIGVDCWEEKYRPPEFARGSRFWMPWPEDGWMPIATAPLDGTEVLLRNAEDHGYGCWEDYNLIYEWKTEGTDFRWSRSFDGEPTEWRPTPPPPHEG
jgi:hypothetical protein